MTYVVCEPCVKCKYTDCVDVCPVDCFVEGVNFLAINPDECIDCGACVPECPTTAIFEETEVPEKWAEYVELNAKLAGIWPTISAKKDALPEADEFKDVEDKLDDTKDRVDGNPASRPGPDRTDDVDRRF